MARKIQVSPAQMAFDLRARLRTYRGYYSRLSRGWGIPWITIMVFVREGVLDARISTLERFYTAMNELDEELKAEAELDREEDGG